MHVHGHTGIFVCPSVADVAVSQGRGLCPGHRVRRWERREVPCGFKESTPGKACSRLEEAGVWELWEWALQRVM